MSEVLIVEDEDDIGELISDILEDQGYLTKYINNSSDVISYLKKTKPRAVILDIWLEDNGMDGIALLKIIKKNFPNVPVVIISGHGNIETAVQAIKLGAYDFIEKPFKSERLQITVKRALEAAELKQYNTILKEKIPKSALIGTSKVISELRNQINSIASKHSRVLIIGELGSGKKSLANIIHQLSKFSDKPIVTVSVIKNDLQKLEELFSNKEQETSIFKQAQHSTLFIDEVFNLPMRLQKKLLEMLQLDFYQSVSHSALNFRLITSTSYDLKKFKQDKRINVDLYSRLSTQQIYIPPLRERKQDIQPIIDYFLNDFSHEYGVDKCTLSDEAYSALIAYDWPQNVTQLMNIIERLLIKISNSNTKEISVDMLPAEILDWINNEHREISVEKSVMISKKLKDAREEFEKTYIKTQLNRFGGNIKKTADFIEMERAALHRKMKSLGL